MQQANIKVLRKLSILILVLTLIASTGGLLIEDLYRDNPFVTLVWRTTDLITLIVVCPLLFAAVFFLGRGSTRWLIILLAMLDFTLYNFAYYLFGAAFNWFFLIYVVLFVLSGAALIVALIGTNPVLIKKQFHEKTPVKWVSGYMLFVAIGLTVIYLMMIFGFIFLGQPLAIIEKTGHITNVVFALDLTLVVPVLILGSIWIWKRKPWGYILAGISVIKGSLYTFVLAVVSTRASIAGFPDSAGEIPLWVILTIGGVLASVGLLVNIDPSQKI